ncbi:YeiH family protein [Metabacillus litoralis]|uniref:YeiH family protein n=1 Tax=Metabacillus litoralis TaxID=152268 RepID=UPI001CFF49C6|nr:putative sulfate exporter family transporter [Metabacillus litoralis]
MTGLFVIKWKYEKIFYGLSLILFLSILASLLAKLPLLSIMGQLVLAILIGFVWKELIGVREDVLPVITFSSQKLLRLGIILLGMRLNLLDIYQAGVNVFLLALFNVLFTIITVYFVGTLFKIDSKLKILIACGTAICGAAAVMAISSQIKSNARDTATAIGIVCLLGTVFTIIFTFIYPYFGFNSLEFGVFVGGTLHEVAHVIAAAASVDSVATDMAVIVKLTRVVLLVPVAIIIGLLVNPYKKEKSKKSPLPFPWFIIGFLFMSLLNTVGFIPTQIGMLLVKTSYVLMGMAMVALGLNLEFQALKTKGKSAFITSLIGSVLLTIISYLAIRYLTF